MAAQVVSTRKPVLFVNLEQEELGKANTSKPSYPAPKKSLYARRGIAEAIAEKLKHGDPKPKFESKSAERKRKAAQSPPELEVSQFVWEVEYCVACFTNIGP